MRSPKKNSKFTFILSHPFSTSLKSEYSYFLWVYFLCKLLCDSYWEYIAFLVINNLRADDFHSFSCCDYEIEHLLFYERWVRFFSLQAAYGGNTLALCVFFFYLRIFFQIYQQFSQFVYWHFLFWGIKITRTFELYLNKEMRKYS